MDDMANYHLSEEMGNTEPLADTYDHHDGQLGNSYTADDVSFGSTVTFSDGTNVTNPKQDAQYQVYPTPSDYYHGTNAHTLDPSFGGEEHLNGRFWRM